MKNSILFSTLFLLLGCSTVTTKEVDPKYFEFWLNVATNEIPTKSLDTVKFIGITNEKAYIERKIIGNFGNTTRVDWVSLKDLPKEVITIIEKQK